MPWTYTIRRLIPGQDRLGACFGRDRDAEQHCSREGVPTYRFEAVDPDTGEVRLADACTNHAARLAFQRGLEFPPKRIA